MALFGSKQTGLPTSVLLSGAVSRDTAIDAMIPWKQRILRRLLVRSIDQVASAEKMAIIMIHELRERGIKSYRLTGPFLGIDSSTPMGEAIIGIMAVLAQLRVSTI